MSSMTGYCPCILVMIVCFWCVLLSHFLRSCCLYCSCVCFYTLCVERWGWEALFFHCSHCVMHFVLLFCMKSATQIKFDWLIKMSILVVVCLQWNKLWLERKIPHVHPHWFVCCCLYALCICTYSDVCVCSICCSSIFGKYLEAFLVFLLSTENNSHNANEEMCKIVSAS